MSKHGDLPNFDVLNFFHDNRSDCALTVLVHGVRFHVIVDTQQLTGRSSAAKALTRQYRRLLSRVKRAKEEVIEEDGGGVSDESDEVEAEEDDANESDETRDSAVDVSHDAKHSSKETSDPAIALYEWMLSAIQSKLNKQAPLSRAKKSATVQEWYHCETHFYRLAIQDDELIGEEESPSESLERRINELIPSMHLPKYIKDLHIPMFGAADVKILATSTEVEPIHPALVSVDGNKYFLKVVDNTQHSPTKREINIMKQIEQKKLHEEMHVPLVQGLVHFQENNSAAMGFLMDAIEGPPTPLTLKLSSDVTQEKRDEWAAESKRMVDLLHENGIIWGDAKGDNFMVDSNDELWIIDFGGSYTEGWVDPELKETEEGDNMGIGRLVESLHNPDDEEAGTSRQRDSRGGLGDDGNDLGPKDVGKQNPAGSRKRKADGTSQDESDSSGEPNTRRPKHKK